MEFEINVTDEFIAHRDAKAKVYNQRGRSDRVFKMNLDAELVEHYKITSGDWKDYPDEWRVDAINEHNMAIDVKFIRKYWNVSREKTLNLFKQRNIIEGFDFYEWGSKPNRPLVGGDRVSIRPVGLLSYGLVVDNLKKSFHEPDGFYVDVRRILNDDSALG